MRGGTMGTVWCGSRLLRKSVSGANQGRSRSNSSHSANDRVHYSLQFRFDAFMLEGWARYTKHTDDLSPKRSRSLVIRPDLPNPRTLKSKLRPTGIAISSHLKHLKTPNGPNYRFEDPNQSKLKLYRWFTVRPTPKPVRIIIDRFELLVQA